MVTHNLPCPICFALLCFAWLLNKLIGLVCWRGSEQKYKECLFVCLSVCGGARDVCFENTRTAAVDIVQFLRDGFV